MTMSNICIKALTPYKANVLLSKTRAFDIISGWGSFVFYISQTERDLLLRMLSLHNMLTYKKYRKASSESESN